MCNRLIGVDRCQIGLNGPQLPWEEVNPNISRKLVMKNRMMMVYCRFRALVAWPEEKHEAEQGGYIIQGKIVLKLPDENQKCNSGPWRWVSIESNKRHSWKVLDDDVILVDFFSPPRKELMKQRYAPMQQRPEA